MKPLLLLFFAFGIVNLAFAQGDTALLEAKAKSKTLTGKERFDSMIDYIALIPTDQAKTAIVEMDTVMNFVYEFGDSILIGKAHRAMAILYMRFNDINKTIYHARIAEKILDRYPETKDDPYVSNTLGLAYSILGNFPKALFYHTRSFESRKNSGDQFMMSISLNNIGFVHYKFRNYKLAQLYYQQAIAMRLASGEEGDINRIYGNLGLSLIYQNEIKKGRECITYAMGKCSGACLNTVIYELYSSLGVADYEAGAYESAEKNFRVGLDHFRESGDKRFVLEILIFLIRIDIHNKQFTHAQQLIAEGESIAYQENYKQLLMELLREKIILQKNSGLQKEAFDTQLLFLNLKDSVNGNQVTVNLIGHSDIPNGEKLSLNLQQFQNRTNMVLVFTAAGVVVLFGWAIYSMVKLNKSYKKVSQLLSELKENVGQENLPEQA